MILVRSVVELVSVLSGKEIRMPPSFVISRSGVQVPASAPHRSNNLQPFSGPDRTPGAARGQQPSSAALLACGALVLLLSASSAGAASRVASWPATVPAVTLQEVDRLIGRRFDLSRCIRQHDGSGCPADALWIQFQARPKGWTALAVADRSSNLIGIFPDAVLEHAKLQTNDVWFKIALGRVAAHEIVHLLVRDRDHWGNGLMKSHLARETLTSLRLLPLED